MGAILDLVRRMETARSRVLIFQGCLVRASSQNQDKVPNWGLSAFFFFWCVWWHCLSALTKVSGGHDLLACC